MLRQRRRIYLIKTGLQLRYMGIVVSTMLLVSFAVGWIIYSTSWSRISNTPDLTIDKLAEIFDEVNSILLRWIFVFLVAIACLSIFVSHKIAGPVYRFEKTAKIIASGDLTQRVRLRHGDELKELQDAFNVMADSLCNIIKKDREVIEQLISAGNKLSESIKKSKHDPQAIESVTKDLYNIIEDLRKITRGFKIPDDQVNLPKTENIKDLQKEENQANN